MELINIFSIRIFLSKINIINKINIDNKNLIFEFKSFLSSTEQEYKIKLYLKNNLI